MARSASPASPGAPLAAAAGDRSPARSRRTTSWAARVAALAVGTALALVTAEVGLWVVEDPRYHVWEPGLAVDLRPSPARMPGVQGPSRFSTSSAGLRGREIPAGPGPRLLAVGGSTTECLYLDDREAWPHLLERQLAAALDADVWVGNAGKSGASSRHHRLQVERLLDQLPDVRWVVVLAGVNDLQLRLGADSEVTPFGALPESERDELLRGAFRHLPRHASGETGLRATALWRTARRVGRAVSARGVVQDTEGRVYDRWRAHRRAAGELRSVPPDLGPALADYRANLVAVARLARARGVEPVLVTQPAMWRDGLPAELERLLWMGGVGDFQRHRGQPYYTPGALAQAMARYNAATLAVCRSEGVQCVDLAGLPADTSVFYDDVHFNEAGARRVAAVLAAALLPRLAAAPPGAAREREDT